MPCTIVHSVQVARTGNLQISEPKHACATMPAGAPVRLAPPAQPMLALAPPHLALASAAAGSGNGGRASRMHATYVAWGNRGDKVGWLQGWVRVRTL